MMHSNLHQTVFNIERLRNAVNVGSCSAYQIYTSPGENLGKIGTIINPTARLAANEKEFPVENAGHAGNNIAADLFRKVFSALNS